MIYNHAENLLINFKNLMHIIFLQKISSNIECIRMFSLFSNISIYINLRIRVHDIYAIASIILPMHEALPKLSAISQSKEDGRNVKKYRSTSMDHKTVQFRFLLPNMFKITILFIVCYICL